MFLSANIACCHDETGEGDGVDLACYDAVGAMAELGFYDDNTDFTTDCEETEVNGVMTNDAADTVTEDCKARNETHGGTCVLIGVTPSTTI